MTTTAEQIVREAKLVEVRAQVKRCFDARAANNACLEKALQELQDLSPGEHICDSHCGTSIKRPGA